MNRSDFEASPSGRLAPTIKGQMAFVPSPLPPLLDLAELAHPLAEAASALGELNGVSGQLPNPYLLIRPLQRREAVSSSNIEGTYSSISEVMMLEVSGRPAPPHSDALEVLNYVQALEQALHELKELPLCLRVIRNAHRRLLTGVSKHRGANIVPGEFKRDQNWIGGSHRDIERARFVPPPPAEALECLSQLENYIQREDHRSPHVLIDAALIHYQFETIHPFPDGNGRVGRMLTTLFLHERRAQKLPLLYMSQFLEDRKDEYIDRMFEVSRTGAWTEWVTFFLEGVAVSARDTISLIERLVELKKQYEETAKVAGRSALLLRIIDIIFEAPVMSVPELARRLGTTYRGALNNIEKLLQSGIIREYPGATPKLFVADEVLRALDPNVRQS